MGSLALGELVPAGAEDVERLAEKRGVEDLLLDLGEAIERGVPAIPVLPQSPGKGEPEEVGGLHEGSQGQRVEVASPHRGTEEAVEVGGGHGGSASRVPGLGGTRGTGRLPRVCRWTSRVRGVSKSGRTRQRFPKGKRRHATAEGMAGVPEVQAETPISSGSLEPPGRGVCPPRNVGRQLLCDASSSGRANVREIQSPSGHRHLTTTALCTRVDIQGLATMMRRCHPQEKG